MGTSLFITKHQSFSLHYVVISLVATLLLLGGCSTTSSTGPRTIEAHKTCPLCGMYPARYLRFQCQIVFQDGTYEAFDSTAGLLVYLHFPEKTGLRLKKIHNIYFKDYRTEKWIQAPNTFLIIGSDVMGPMGAEILPTNNHREAKKMNEEENGKEIVSFNRVDRQYLIKAAENGWLHYLAKKTILE